MKRLLVCVMAMAALAVGTTRAEAAIFTLTAGGAGDTVFFNPVAGCTTCSATATFTLTDQDTLTVVLTNTSTDGITGQNLLTALGFDTTPDIALASYQITSAFVDASGWQVSTTTNSTLQMEVLADTTNGVNNALDNGQSLTITMNLTSLISSLTLDDSRIHVQALAGGGSIKLTGEGDGGGSTEGGGSSPEPATMLLFGLALTGAGLRMRRSRS